MAEYETHMGGDGEDNPPPGFASLPLQIGWLEATPEVIQQQAKEILEHFNQGMLYLQTLKADTPTHEHDDDGDCNIDPTQLPIKVQQGAMLVGLTNTFIEMSMAMAHMETYKAGRGIGIDPEVLQDCLRSLFSGVMLMCIRYGQSNPLAFTEFEGNEQALAALMQEGLDRLTETEKGAED